MFGLLAAVLFESLFYCRFKLIANRIASQVALVGTMVAFTWVVIYSIVDFPINGFYGLYYLAWMAAVYYFYRVRTIDVLVLSSWVVSGIIAIVVTIGRTIDNDLDGGTFLLFGLVIIGLSTMGGKWLMGLLKEQKDSPKGESA